jgi:peptidoglycan endopeptidase LytE
VRIAAAVILATFVMLAATASAGAAERYVVARHDTLYRIAQRFRVSVSLLAQANHLHDPSKIRVGMVLLIPDPPSTIRSRHAMASPTHGVGRTPRVTPVRASASAPVSVVAGPGRTATLGHRISASALHYLGTPYVWGGASEAGVDCSGLVFLVYSPYVPHLPRMSFDQWTIGAPVEETALVPGDLVFFDTAGPGASHVGIYIGDGQFVHSASRSHKVVVDRLDAPYYAVHYLGARRVL